MTTIAARPPYAPPAVPKAYDGDWLRTQLASLARALKPTTGRTVKAATTIAATDEVLYADATAGPFTVTLLPASQVQFLTITIKKVDSTGSAVTIGGTCDGVVNPTLATQWKAKTLHSDGTQWLVLATV